MTTSRLHRTVGPRLRAATLIALVALLAVAAPALAHPRSDPAGYAWVTPPPGVTSTAPPAQGREVTLDEDLLAQGRADVWTPDLQALVTVIGAPPVTVRLAPLDPATLPEVPDLEVSGNAYEVALDAATRPDAVVTLRPPHLVTTVARWDGERWHLTEVTLGPDGEVRASWDGPGPYVAAASRLDGHGSSLGALVHDPLRATLAALGLIGVSIGLDRRRRAEP